MNKTAKILATILFLSMMTVILAPVEAQFKPNTVKITVKYTSGELAANVFVDFIESRRGGCLFLFSVCLH